jgi:50S ribosomal subunit-associated GTPase HflX
MSELLAELSSALRPAREFVELAIPPAAASVVARLHQIGEVIERDYEGDVAL